MTNPFTIKLPPGVLETGIWRVDWSSFSHILDCYRDGWHFNSWRRILPGWDPSRGFGSAIHAAEHVRFKGWGSGPYDTKCMKAMEEVLAQSFTERVKCGECAGENYCPACAGRGFVEQQIESHEGDHRTLGRAIEVMAEYDKLHPVESFEVLASELAGERELGVVEWWLENAYKQRSPQKCQVVWQYRIDRLIQDRNSGRVAVMDTKTTASSSVQFDQVRNEFKMSPQFRLYTWAASALGYGEVLEAAVDHIIVRKPLLRPKPDSRPRNEFNRILLSWTAEQIEECRQGVLDELGAFLTACGRWGRAPQMNGAPKNCHRYTHTCPYLQVCEQADERSRIGWLLGGNYVDNQWRAFAPPEEKATTI